MARETLQQQLEKLTRPQTDFDIEDHDLRPEAFGNEESESDDSNSENEVAKRDHYVSVNKSQLRSKANGGVRLGGKYEGSAISRDNLYAQDDSQDEEDSEDLDQDEDEEEEESSGEENDDEEEEEEDDSGASLRANSDSEEESESEDDQELTHKRNKLKQMMSKEKMHIVGRLSQEGTNNALKGFAILQQHKLFDSLIDTRMKFQPALANSNMLPASKEVLEHEDLVSKKTEKYITRTKDVCYDLLDKIYSLRQQFIDSDSISTTKVKLPKKRKLTDYLATAESFDSILNKYRQSVLVKWSAKIQNTSGSSAINSGKFKVINQSAEQQVQNNLMDMERLIKRTRTNRRQIVPLGHQYYLELAKTDIEEKNQEASDDENADIPKSQTKDQNNMQQIDTIFDDDDFYRLLLNDLVDRKIQAQNPTSGLSITMRSAKTAAKFKKNVDTKASKGRKLRYQIQEPIANFETSKGGWKWNDEQIDEFFASLLGQKVNMAEDDNEDEGMASEEELVTTGEGAIKLFG